MNSLYHIFWIRLGRLGIGALADGMDAAIGVTSMAPKGRTLLVQILSQRFTVSCDGPWFENGAIARRRRSSSDTEHAPVEALRRQLVSVEGPLYFCPFPI